MTTICGSVRLAVCFKYASALGARSFDVGRSETSGRFLVIVTYRGLGFLMPAQSMHRWREAEFFLVCCYIPFTTSFKTIQVFDQPRGYLG